MASATQVCNGTLYPLADFDFVDFHGISDATTTKGGSLNKGSFGPLDVTMVSGSTVLAKVTTTWSKDAFVDTWKALG
jgi:hypothetical protein